MGVCRWGVQDFRGCVQDLAGPGSAGPPPSAGPPQNVALFSLSHPNFLSFFSLFLGPGLHTTTRELQMCTFQGPGASNTIKIPRKDPKREKKERKLWREREKKREILGFLAPPFWAPHFWPPLFLGLGPPCRDKQMSGCEHHQPGERDEDGCANGHCTFARNRMCAAPAVKAVLVSEVQVRLGLAFMIEECHQLNTGDYCASVGLNTSSSKTTFSSKTTLSSKTTFSTKTALSTKTTLSTHDHTFIP